MLIEIKSPLRLLRRKSAPDLPNAIQLTTDPRNLFYTYAAGLNGLLSGNTKRIDTTTATGQATAYEVCPVVSGAIGKIQESARNGRWEITDAEGNPTKKSSDLAALMDRPNPLQTWPDFIAQGLAYMKTYGWSILLPAKAAGTNSVYSLWALPNYLINEVKYTGKVFYQNDINEIIEYFRIGEAKITPDQVIILTDSTIVSDNSTPSNILPQSRMFPLSDPVSNIVQAYAARYTLMAKKGAIGILSNDSKDAAGMIPLTADEKREVQTQFQNDYGLGYDQNQVIMTSAALKWQSMTFPTKDLMLFEEIKDSALVVYDAYGVPVFLTPFADQTTYTNLNAAEKRFYTTVVIPATENIAGTIGKYFKLEDQNLELRVYFDHLEIFQKSKKDEADALKSITDALNTPYVNRILTMEEYRAIISDFMPSGVPFDAETVNGTTYYQETIRANNNNETPTAE